MNFLKNIFQWLISLFKKEKIENEEKQEEVKEEMQKKEEILEDIPIVIEQEPKLLILSLNRVYTCPKYTIGKLYVNNEYFCDTIEDTDRYLFDTMSEEEILSKKIYGETAIPCGTYNITMNIKSPKYSNFTKYKWAEPYDGYLPRLLNVKGYEGVLIHVMNTAEESCGCIGVGENKENGKVLNSKKTFFALMNNYLLPAKDKEYDIQIKISQNYT